MKTLRMYSAAELMKKFSLSDYKKRMDEVIEKGVKLDACTINPKVCLYLYKGRYFMISPCTGVHSLNLKYTDIDRLNAHWEGFKRNQPPKKQ